MSNIEPTEEHYDVSRAFVAKQIDDYYEVRHNDLARLLAEREAKLQARIDDLTERSARRLDDSTAIDALVYAIACLELQPGSERDRAVRDALNRVINHVGAIEVRARDSATKVVSALVAGAKAREDALTARVAELENSLAACRGTLFADDRYNEARTREAVMPSFDCGGENCGRISCSDCTDDDLHARYWQELGKGPGGDAGAERRARAWWTTEGKRLKAVTEREAQHLAGIKALHQFLGDHEEEEGIWIPRSEFKDVPCRKYLAHYDDAKAAEGGEG